MTLRRQNTIAAREGRTQEARIAALFARPRTRHHAGKCVLKAVASLFSSLLGRACVTACPKSEAMGRQDAETRGAAG